MNLQLIDFILIGITLIISSLVAVRGFFDEISKIFGYIGGFFIALIFTKEFSSFIHKQTLIPLWLATALSYFILFLTGFLLIKTLGHSFQKFFTLANLQILDHVLGFVIGIFESFIIIGFILTLLSTQNFFNSYSLFSDSLVYNKIINPVFSIFTGYVNNITKGL